MTVIAQGDNGPHRAVTERGLELGRDAVVCAQIDARSETSPQESSPIVTWAFFEKGLGLSPAFS